MQPLAGRWRRFSRRSSESRRPLNQDGRPRVRKRSVSDSRLRRTRASRKSLVRPEDSGTLTTEVAAYRQRWEWFESIASSTSTRRCSTRLGDRWVWRNMRAKDTLREQTVRVTIRSPLLARAVPLCALHRTTSAVSSQRRRGEIGRSAGVTPEPQRSVHWLRCLRPVLSVRCIGPLVARLPRAGVLGRSPTCSHVRVLCGTTQEPIHDADVCRQSHYVPPRGIERRRFDEQITSK
jgi:hypothetical protein